MNNETELESVIKLQALAKEEIDLAEISLRVAADLIHSAIIRNANAGRILDYTEGIIREAFYGRTEQMGGTNNLN